MNEATKPASVWHRVICITISFLQSLFFALLAGCIGFLFILSANFTVNTIKSSNYVDFAITEMKQDLNDLAIPASLPENFFDDKFSNKDISDFEETLTSKVAASIHQEDYTVDTDAIKVKFQTDVENYVTEILGPGGTVSDEAISQFVNECTTTYLQYLNPSLLQIVLPNFSPIVKVLKIITIAAFVLSIVIFIFLFKLCSKKEFCLYYFSSFLGGGLMLGLVPAYLLITKTVSKINISLTSLYNFVTSYLSNALEALTIISGVLILFSVVFLILEFIPYFYKKQPRETTKNT